MTWEPSPLVVDGSRECVRLVAALPSDWTTEGERFVLHVMACDAFERESAPGLDNLAAWTGMRRASVARIIARLLQPNDVRPALLVKTNVSKGRATSRYRLQLSPTVTVPRETVTVSQLSPNRPPTETDNCLPTVSQPSTVGDTPSPSPDNPSLSANQRAVANALGLKDDDERLNSVDQMLKSNGAQKPIGWIRSCAKNGDLERLLEDAHGTVSAGQWQHAQINAELDGLWGRIVRHHGQDKAQELYDHSEADLAASYPNGVPKRALLMDLIHDLAEVKAS